MSPTDPAKPRPQSEWLMQVIQPPTRLLVRLLARLRVNPLWVVAAHSLVGLFAAVLITFGPQNFIAAALLLQVKTLLDNADGGLARVTDRVTRMGRYFDTVMDFAVNLVLFAALALYGPPPLALGALLLLTVILSLDHNMEYLYKTLRHPEEEDDDEELPIGAPQPLYRFFRGGYNALFTPQDRLVRHLDRKYFEDLSGFSQDRAPLDLRLAWNDMFSTSTLVNLGLSTQLFVLGLCLALGHPFWYIWSVYIQALYVTCVMLVRGFRFQGYLRGASDA